MTENAVNTPTPAEQVQKGWHDLQLRVEQLEIEYKVLEQENKNLRRMLETVIEHRQKSHGELVLLLTGLVSKLPISDIGTTVAKLVEHNNHVSEVLAALVKGTADATLPQPALLKELEQVKRELKAAIAPAVEELIGLEPPLEPDLLRSFVEKPELFFSPRAVRAARCFIKGQIARERIVKEFGDEALAFFQDMTTDPKLNPRPKPEEIVLAFKSDFESLVQQDSALPPDKRQALTDLYQRVQRSKAATETARLQRNLFQRISFMLDLLHYYENQGTEAPDVVFAQRLPALIEQLVISGPQDGLDEKLIQQAENLLAFVVNPDYRQAIINNVGKAGGLGKTLKHVLTLRSDKVSDPHGVITDFIKHLVPAQKAPTTDALTPILRLLKSDMQRSVVLAIMDSDRIPKQEADVLGKALAKELGIAGLDAPRKAPELPPEMERQMAWERVKDLITSRSDPGAIAGAIRDRLHAKYDPDEMKQSWITLTEADPISLIRVFCQLPYLADGRTDPVARAVMETYVTRLMHEKYAATYSKIVNSLKNMFRANPNSPTLVNFMALVKWVDPEAANKLSADIGMAVAA